MVLANKHLHHMRGNCTSYFNCFKNIALEVKMKTFWQMNFTFSSVILICQGNGELAEATEKVGTLINRCFGPKSFSLLISTRLSVNFL